MVETVRAATPGDCDAMADIYNHYVRDTVITFEEEPISAEELRNRLSEVQSGGLPWLVAMEGDAVSGYAYAGKWKGRCAYRYTVEISIYLRNDQTGKGIGTRLYAALCAVLRAKQLHVVIGGIALPNAASVALHESLGMTKVAHFPEVGFKLGRWVDVGYWQMRL